MFRVSAGKWGLTGNDDTYSCKGLKKLCSMDPVVSGEIIRFSDLFAPTRLQFQLVSKAQLLPGPAYRYMDNELWRGSTFRLGCHVFLLRPAFSCRSCGTNLSNSD